MARDRVLIDELEVRCVIGVDDWERHTSQLVLVSVELELDLGAAAAADALEHTIDYADACRRIRELAAAGRFRLIETLAERAAGALLEHTRAERITVTVRKPAAVSAATVGVSVTRP